MFDVSLVLYNTSQLLLIAAFLLTDILWLRVVTLIAFATFISSAGLSHDTNMFVWGMVFAGINVVQVLKLGLQRRSIKLHGSLMGIYSEVFTIMTPAEFQRFWALGTIFETEDDFICHDGDTSSKLSLVLDGEVHIHKANKDIVTLRKGCFLFEMTFLTGEPVSADVQAVGKVRYISWPFSQLLLLQRKESVLYQKLQSIIGVDLIHKLQDETSIIRELLP